MHRGSSEAWYLSEISTLLFKIEGGGRKLTRLVYHFNMTEYYHFTFKYFVDCRILPETRNSTMALNRLHYFNYSSHKNLNEQHLALLK